MPTPRPNNKNSQSIDKKQDDKEVKVEGDNTGKEDSDSLIKDKVEAETVSDKKEEE